MSQVDDTPLGGVYHFMVAFVGQSDVTPSNAAIADSVGKAFQLNGVVPMYGATYTMPYQVDPRTIGLPEAWNELDEQVRHEIEVQYPRLAIAITMLVPQKNETKELPDG